MAKRAKGKASKATSAPYKVADTLAFYNDDFAKTLFPLRSNLILIQNGENNIKKFIEDCLNDEIKDHHFLPQRRVYAAKSAMHLRRTVKLDCVSEYYLYDVVFRNRKLFRKPHQKNRVHYGYRFEAAAPITATSSYKAFKGAMSEYSKKYSHSLSFDVSCYFNNVYHHDIVSWFAELGASESDASGLGQLLRQINSGRSVDCLPQGLYPTKMIGSDFLRFVDDHYALKAAELVRFMDDFCIFSNDLQSLMDDFQAIQRLLGDKDLSVNPLKTIVDVESQDFIDRQIDDVKKRLLQRRRYAIISYDDAGEAVSTTAILKHALSEQELSYIEGILNRPDIEEDDAELVLTIMRDHTALVEKRLPYIVSKFPHLAKNVHGFCSNVANKDRLSVLIRDSIDPTQNLMEYQLFWFGAILEDYLLETPNAGVIATALLNHPSATPISKAKVLEIADQRFGLPEVRNEHLTSGQSDWLAWASAVGTRSLPKISRNHRLKYFGNSSPMNHLIATIVLSL